MRTVHVFYTISLGLVVLCSSCNDFLNKTPLSEITPEHYLLTESDLESYVNGLYTNILPSHNNVWSYGMFGWDAHTDNQAAWNYSNKFVPGQYKVSHSEESEWKFTNIYSCNYFLARTVPLFESGGMSGNLENIKYYIGEAYFLRAYEYFVRYQKMAD